MNTEWSWGQHLWCRNVLMHRFPLNHNYKLLLNVSYGVKVVIYINKNEWVCVLKGGEYDIGWDYIWCSFIKTCFFITFIKTRLLLLLLMFSFKVRILSSTSVYIYIYIYIYMYRLLLWAVVLNGTFCFVCDSAFCT